MRHIIRQCRTWAGSPLTAITILLVAAIIRIHLLHDIPPGLSRDEVRNADITTFIRRGEHSLFFGTGYGHEPLYHYFAVPFQVLLGDNVLSIRLPSVYIGMFLVAATMRWAKRDFGRLTAVVTGIGLSVGWQPVVFSRIGIRPIMEPLMLVGAAWYWQKKPVWAGICLGLSLYTYTSARLVFALPLLFALIIAVGSKLEHRSLLAPTSSSYIRSSIIILAILILMYLPLHFTLQADPALQQRVQQLQGPLTNLLKGKIRPVLEKTIATAGVISFAGPPRWTYTISGLPLFDWISATFFYAGLAIASWRIQNPRYSFALVWLLIGMLPSAITPHSPSMNRFIGATPVLYLCPGIFVSAIGKKLREKNISQLGLLFPFILYFLSLVNHTITNGFLAWPAAEETHYKYQTVLRDIGRHWAENPASSMVVAQSFWEPIEMDTIKRNMGYDVGARWVQTGAHLAGAVVYPNDGHGLLYVPEYAAPHADLLDAANITEQPVYRSEDRPSFSVYALEHPPHVPLPVGPVLFEGEISLLGYKLIEQTGAQLHLITYWQVVSFLPPDLAIFTHVLDADGALVTQHDGLDATPSTLSPGDIVIQRHLLPLSNGLPENYTLQVGLYTRDNNRRLAHSGGAFDRVILSSSNP